MDLESWSGWALIIGGLMFFVAAFNPSSQVFMNADLGQKLEIVRSRKGLWVASQGFFGMGAVVTAVGVALLAARQRQPPGDLLWFAAAAFLVGALLWGLHTYQRAVDPEAFLRAELTAWLFPVYTVLTLAGLFMVGISIPLVGYPTLLGYALAIGGAIMLVAYLALGDLPPFFIYILTLVLGVFIR